MRWHPHGFNPLSCCSTRPFERALSPYGTQKNAREAGEGRYLNSGGEGRKGYYPALANLFGRTAPFNGSIKALAASSGSRIHPSPTRMLIAFALRLKL